MALTRKMLEAMGIEENKIDQIIEAHTETVNALKDQRDSFKSDAEKLPAVQKQLDELQKSSNANNKDSWKVKYDALKEEYDNYKTDVQSDKVKAEKTGAFKELLKSVGVSEKRIEAILKVSGEQIDSINLVDGKIDKVDDLTSSVKSEWADFISTESMQNPPPPPTPPKVDNNVDKAKFMKMSYAERVNLKEANPDLYEKLRK